ncbi:MAG: cobyrinate a,c-diamide synthase, partial [Actinomycetota bacterium]|nr:cobyrinate a,c-diamide synthase [Actinomycetota bacterium]
PWLCGTDAIAPLAGRATEGCEILVVEGVMGLFDGAEDPEGPSASTAQVAALIDAPVVLVIDASAMSRSVAALVHGFATFDPSVHVAAVVLNRVGSDSHERMLRAALEPLDIPVLGALRRNESFEWRDRHLGLVPVVEQTGEVRASLASLGAAIAESCDLDGLLEIAHAASRKPVSTPPRAWHQAKVRVGVAAGPAFSFVYQDNLEALEQAGAELVPFDPTSEPHLPEKLDGLYAGGGFPEVFVGALAANRTLLVDLKVQVERGLVTWAECGGLLWLSRALDGHRLAGAVAAEGRMTNRLTLGYRHLWPRIDMPLAPAGTELRAHEFHYSVLEPPGDAIDYRGRHGADRTGFASATLLASYLHLHLGGDPAPAERFIQTAAARPPRG